MLSQVAKKSPVCREQGVYFHIFRTNYIKAKYKKPYLKIEDKSDCLVFDHPSPLSEINTICVMPE